MNAQQSPQEMQNNILERMIKRPEENAEPSVQTTANAPKFIKEFAVLFDSRMKDHAHHEINVNEGATGETRFHRFVKSGPEILPVSMILNDQSQCIAILRCETKTIPFLSRVFFGGDLNEAVSAKSSAFTASEVGLQNLFATWLGKSFRQKTGINCPNAQTACPKDIDLDELQDMSANICNFKIAMGPNECRIELAIASHVIANENFTIDTASASPPFTSEEVAKSPLKASVRLHAGQSTLKQIKHLKVGDFLTLDSSDSLRGCFTVRDQDIFEGEIGKSSGRYSIKISRAVPTIAKQ